MTATYQEATDTMFAQLNNLWATDSAAIAGYIPNIYWPNIEEPVSKPVDAYWARMSRQTVLQQQSNLTGADQLKRYTTRGLVSVQIFAPMMLVSSGIVLSQLAQIVQNAYRGVTTSNGIWFRNATIKELPADGRYYRANVTCDFQYDEVS
jgi:hypothetical protein